MQDFLQDYLRIIGNFSRVKVAIIGDIVADIYIYGRPFRLSREAPVIVVKYEEECIVPGGAGNTANNLSKLGARVYPIGIVGEDGPGRALIDYFSRDGVDVSGIFVSKDSGTISKTRLLAGDVHASKRQVVRIDKEPAWKAVPPSLETRILDYMDSLYKEIDAWIISDYGYDIITPRLLERIKEIAREKVVVVDSRYRICEFIGVTIVAPNESEAEAASGIPIEGEDTLTEIGLQLLKKIRPEAVVITRGNKGMMLFEKTGRVESIPICGPNEVTDVTGAGDTVTGLLALGLPAGANYLQAARLSNYAAGVVVMKNGTATLSTSELVEAIKGDLEAKGGGRSN